FTYFFKIGRELMHAHEPYIFLLCLSYHLAKLVVCHIYFAETLPERIDRRYRKVIRLLHIPMCVKIDQSQRFTEKLVVYAQKKQLPIIGKTKAAALLFKGIVQAPAKLYVGVAVGKFVHVATYDYPVGTCQGVLVQKLHLTGPGFK